MSLKKASSSSSSSSSLKSKSPAEFFSEHQNIAGFDNPGKSLYTTCREFVENSLDACEAANRLPEIHLTVQKLESKEFNVLRGLQDSQRIDETLYSDLSQTQRKKGGKKAKSLDKESAENDNNLDGNNNEGKDDEKQEKEGKAGSNYAYYRIICKDNGCGMPFDSIPSMLGIVLSSTKYGVKQTRGKFGLGAKMALVWSKKSTGLPIEIWSSTGSKNTGYCKLDIDIYKNQPKILAHNQLPNSENSVGTTISIVIGGNWTSYASKLVNYLRQLAVITPYAQLKFSYSDSSSEKKSFHLSFNRRTEVMPPQPTEIKHHPSAVDNLLVENLIHHTKYRSLKQFLTKEFSSINANLAERLIKEAAASCREEFDIDSPVESLGKKHIHALVTLLKQAKFDPPPANCLSPAGEYNLRLGIIKELGPELIATHSTVPGVFEGHPFIVECAVSIGGAAAKPGITVYRYANRIPLLFEAGSDIATIIANKQIKWGNYKIKATDKVGVFVSLISTKIPFKGTSKEYIGDDKGELHAFIRSAMSACCSQLKRKIAQHTADKAKADRKRNLIKYIPDVARSLSVILAKMSGISTENGENSEISSGGAVLFGNQAKKHKVAPFHLNSGLLRAAPEQIEDWADTILRGVASREINEELLGEKLAQHVDRIDSEMALEYTSQKGKNLGPSEGIWVHPVSQQDFQLQPVYHPLFQFNPLF
jgi:DNA topoisomerase-6 subunit B